jgi:hypothetical protein
MQIYGQSPSGSVYTQVNRLPETRSVLNAQLALPASQDVYFGALRLKWVSSRSSRSPSPPKEPRRELASGHEADEQTIGVGNKVVRARSSQSPFREDASSSEREESSMTFEHAKRLALNARNAAVSSWRREHKDPSGKTSGDKLERKKQLDLAGMTAYIAELKKYGYSKRGKPLRPEKAVDPEFAQAREEARTARRKAQEQFMMNDEIDPDDAYNLANKEYTATLNEYGYSRTGNLLKAKKVVDPNSPFEQAKKIANAALNDAYNELRAGDNPLSRQQAKKEAKKVYSASLNEQGWTTKGVRRIPTDSTSSAHGGPGPDGIESWNQQAQAASLFQELQQQPSQGYGSAYVPSTASQGDNSSLNRGLGALALGSNPSEVSLSRVPTGGESAGGSVRVPAWEQEQSYQVSAHEGGSKRENLFAPDARYWRSKSPTADLTSPEPYVPDSPMYTPQHPPGNSPSFQPPSPTAQYPVPSNTTDFIARFQQYYGRSPEPYDFPEAKRPWTPMEFERTEHRYMRSSDNRRTGHLYTAIDPTTNRPEFYVRTGELDPENSPFVLMEPFDQNEHIPQAEGSSRAKKKRPASESYHQQPSGKK